MGLDVENLPGLLNPDDEEIISAYLSNASGEWLSWAINELSLGETVRDFHTPQGLCYYLCVLRVAQSLYRDASGKTLPVEGFKKIVQLVLQCWCENWSEAESDLRHKAVTKKYADIKRDYTRTGTWSENIKPHEIILTIKGKCYISSTIKSIQAGTKDSGSQSQQNIKTLPFSPEPQKPTKSKAAKVQSNPHESKGSDYNGPESAPNSLELEFDKITMTTKKEMQAYARRSRGWIDRIFEENDLSPCFILLKKNVSEGYWRKNATKIIDKVKNKRG